jgi:hypothetical protein
LNARLAEQFPQPAHPTRRAGSQTFPQFPRRPVTTNASRLTEGCELLPDIARIDADNQTKIDPAHNGQGEAALNGRAGSRARRCAVSSAAARDTPAAQVATGNQADRQHNGAQHYRRDSQNLPMPAIGAAAR